MGVDQELILNNTSVNEEIDNEEVEVERICDEGRPLDSDNQEGKGRIDNLDHSDKSLEDLIKIVEDEIGRNKGSIKEYEEIMDRIMVKIGQDKEGVTSKKRIKEVGVKLKDSGRRKRGKENNAKRRFSRKKVRFKEMQVLYKKNRQLLARTLMGAPSKCKCPLSKEDLEEYYEVRLSKVNEKNNLRGFAKYEKRGEESDDVVLLGPVTIDDVNQAIKAMDVDTAAGPDRMTLKEIIKIFNKDNTLLPRLYTIWIKTGKIPDEMKLSRTVLIPKVNNEEELKDINNWRPITIGPIMLRLFTKIMAGRVNKVINLNKKQKGFVTGVQGCEENIKILENIFKGSKKKRKDLAVVFVDLTKAFDTKVLFANAEGGLQELTDKPVVAGMNPEMKVNTGKTHLKWK
ncbi:hypothetical protein chiPu_0019501 [Chiloscyllium punctatum]|uniref:Uncharacterized protein n=1 Tax=Chiloscyllium punctatum TaxID=137246 RepID=A0A401RS75_CHIPU|nr:hypothetical protein [Chiloscyllium punctatum]